MVVSKILADFEALAKTHEEAEKNHDAILSKYEALDPAGKEQLLNELKANINPSSKSYSKDVSLIQTIAIREEGRDKTTTTFKAGLSKEDGIYGDKTAHLVGDQYKDLVDLAKAAPVTASPGTTPTTNTQAPNTPAAGTAAGGLTAGTAQEYLNSYKEVLSSLSPDAVIGTVKKDGKDVDVKVSDEIAKVDAALKDPKHFADEYTKVEAGILLSGDKTKDRAAFKDFLKHDGKDELLAKVETLAEAGDDKVKAKLATLKGKHTSFLNSIADDEDELKVFDKAKADITKDKAGFWANLKEGHKDDFIGQIIGFIEKIAPNLFHDKDKDPNTNNLANNQQAPNTQGQQNNVNNGPGAYQPLGSTSPNAGEQLGNHMNNTANKTEGTVAGLGTSVLGVGEGLAVGAVDVAIAAPVAVYQTGKKIVQRIGGAVSSLFNESDAHYNKEEAKQYNEMTNTEKALYQDAQKLAVDANRGHAFTDADKDFLKTEKKSLDKISDLLSQKGEQLSPQVMDAIRNNKVDTLTNADDKEFAQELVKSLAGLKGAVNAQNELHKTAVSPSVSGLVNAVEVPAQNGQTR